jgi:hypothetical protein
MFAFRYVRVRYDDLANPGTRTKVVDSLYEFMGVRFTEDVAERVNTFLRSESQDEINKYEYWTTYRNESFDPYHWKSDLKEEV